MWFDRGVNREKIQAEKAKSVKTFRFFLAKGEEARVVFMEEEPIAIAEHTIRFPSPSGKTIYRHYTCRRVIGGRCPLCEAGDEPRYTGFMSIIDLRGYEGKNGKVPYTRKVFPMSTSVLEWWETVQDAAKERGGHAAGSKFLLKREGKAGEPSVGGIRSYIDVVDLSKFTYERDGKTSVLSPFDFEKILYPLSEADLRGAAAALGAEEADDGRNVGSDQDWAQSAEGGDSDTSYT